ncbi:hypothetical protein D4764_18G0002780, partial [Takifugu flavidus]
GAEVGRADNHRFLGLQVTTDSWTLKTAARVKKETQQQLYLIRLLREGGLNRHPLTEREHSHLEHRYLCCFNLQ